MSFVRQLTIASTLALSLSFAAAHAETFKVIRASNAAETLQPGDLLFAMVKKGGSWYEKLIRYAQQGFQAFSGFFRAEMKKGDPGALHVGMYVGNGELAEAWGSTPKNAAVRVWSLDVHGGEQYLVYRPRDKALAARAVEIARAWATSKMGFLPPAHLPFRLSTYGPKARAAALHFGQNAKRAGGPGNKRMFCSQFLLAVYQAAVVAPKLAANPKLTDRQLAMPRAYQLHAANASPLALLGALRLTLEDATNGWQEVAAVQVDPALYQAAPSVGAQLKALAKEGAKKVGEAFKKLGESLLKKLKR